MENVLVGQERGTARVWARASKGDMRVAMFGALKGPLLGKYQVAWQWPAGVDEAAWTPFDIPSATGSKLAGRYARAQGTRKGVVVCAHPMRRCAKGFFLKSGRAELLRRNGYDVLLFDFNGFGESPQGDFDFPEDVLAAAEVARHVAGGVPVHAVGASFGAGWTLCAAARKPVFDSVVLENPWTTMGEFYAGRPGARSALGALSLMFPGTARRLRPIDMMRALPETQRLMMIACVGDRTTPLGMAKALDEACTIPAPGRELWLVPVAGHLVAYEFDAAAYERRVIGFLDKAAPRAIQPELIELGCAALSGLFRQ
ncbi:MAG: alpha/beta hydrolase family protein [Vulcanimicrobiaceae bacterium]